MRLSQKKSVLLFVATVDSAFCTHRLPIARAARDAGWEVVVATHVTSHDDKIRREGFRLIPIQLRRCGLTPWHDAMAILELVRIYRRERPDLVHHVGIKPVLYGSLAATIAGVPAVINAIAGMGYVFTSSTIKARLLRPLVSMAYKLLLDRPNSRLILQNPDDVARIAGCMVKAERIVLIRGSGVDTGMFQVRPEPNGTPVAVMVSRMIWDKGVGDLVDAARLLRRRGVSLRVVIVGPPDWGHPNSIPERQLRDWDASGDIDWWGERTDIASIWATSHIAVLPSCYGEGVPKTLLEAASCGRPMVATDVPGCREVVLDGITGHLIPQRDPESLADALERLAKDSDVRAAMGAAAHELVEQNFSDNIVIDQTMSLYRSMASVSRLPRSYGLKIMRLWSRGKRVPGQ